ncbi:MAG: branched-chain amino acid ABC transporter substrate-binding protein [Cyanobium sp. CACIAM 14]|nr:MAG: branched-chain amino acid ABC transporter substrate-binding protein [Cyanobium sp. CACIAM 14]
MPTIPRLARGLLVAGVMTLLSACRSGGSGAGPIDATGGVPVGAVIALTGNSSVIGQDQKIGLELAERHFAGSGAPPAAKGVKVKLRLEDGGSDEQTATNAFRTLINGGVAALIGPSLSQQAFAVDPIAQRAGVPVVGPSNTAVGIPQIGSFISRVSAPVSVVAPLSIGAALRQNPAIRRVAVFYAHDDAYSTSESKIFQQALQRRGLQPVTVQRTNVSDTDFQNQVTDTLRLKPELIVISALPMDGGNLVRQIRELGYGGAIVVGNGMNSPNIYPICQKYCDGLLIAQAYSPETTAAINQTFLSLYRQARGGAVPPQFSAQAFTAYQVVFESLQRLQAAQPPGKPLTALPAAELRRRLNSEILAGRYDTPLGPIRFTPEGEVVQERFYVAQVRMNGDGRSGRFQLLP